MVGLPLLHNVQVLTRTKDIDKLWEATPLWQTLNCCQHSESRGVCVCVNVYTCYCAEYGYFVLLVAITEIKLYVDTNLGLKGLSRLARVNQGGTKFNITAVISPKHIYR